ncbi:ParB/Srx family N-terminal domain-containing protein [Paracidovorax avenae]|uniref:ParB/Srx family N-terminal domain-containing protein n=1 Tax=Paracidovorax avenae TaxID=80867 RepID=UPI001CEFA7DD
MARPSLSWPPPLGRLGLLQNLTVVASPEGEQFEVVAGRRRLAALKLLVKRRKLAKDHPVPCLLVPDALARTVNLTENRPKPKPSGSPR